MSVQILESERTCEREYLGEGSIMTKWKTAIGHAFRSHAHGSGQAHPTDVIETEYLENGKMKKKLDGRVLYNPHADSREELHKSQPDSDTNAMLPKLRCSVNPEEWSAVIGVLQSKIQTWLHHPHLAEYNLLFPHGVIERVSKDFVRLASSEPSGLHGMCIHVNLKRKLNNEVIPFGAIQYDSNKDTQFELHLTLIEDRKKWFHLKDLFAPVITECFIGLGKEEIFISPGYQMEKKKLY